MIAVAVAGETSANIKSGLSAGDDKEHTSSGDCAHHLSNDVRHQLRFIESTGSPQTKRNRGIEVVTADMVKAKAMVKTVNPKANDTPSRPMPTSGKVAAWTALPQPPNTSQNVPMNSAPNFFVMEFPSFE